jgi:tRNA (guanosine-2'-O-)-methyltransferase
MSNQPIDPALFPLSPPEDQEVALTPLQETYLRKWIAPDRLERIERVVANRTRQLTVLLEGVHKLHNQNAILRTCDVFGIQDIHIIETETAPFLLNKGITKGVHKWLDLHVYQTPEEAFSHLRNEGYTIFATGLSEASQPLHSLDLTGKVALMFGTELTGISEASMAQVDGLVTIPMFGFSQSMNVSTAAAISLHFAVQQRIEQHGTHGDLPESQRTALLHRYLRLSSKERVLQQLGNINS